MSDSRFPDPPDKLVRTLLNTLNNGNQQCCLLRSGMVTGSGQLIRLGSIQQPTRIVDPDVKNQNGSRKDFIPISVADPDPGYGIRLDPGWVESQHPDPGSGMNNPDHIF